MTNKRGPTPAFFDDGNSDGPSTLRSLEPDDLSPDRAAAPAAVYCKPQPLVAISDHKTIEVETVKLSEDIDPRKLRTELCLPRPVSLPPDLVGPQSNAAVVSTQPPLAPRRSLRALLGLLALSAGVLALLCAGVALRRRHLAVASLRIAQTPLNAPGSSALVATASSAQLARPISVVPKPKALEFAPPGAGASAAPPDASGAAAAPQPTLASTSGLRASPVSASSKPNGAPKNLSQSVSDRPSAVGHDSKSKRAIY